MAASADWGRRQEGKKGELAQAQGNGIQGGKDKKGVGSDCTQVKQVTAQGRGVEASARLFDLQPHVVDGTEDLPLLGRVDDGEVH